MTKMLPKVLFALVVLVTPTFAADRSGSDQMDMKGPGMHGEMHQMMHRPPAWKEKMMQSPAHMLAMAYHQNLVHFAQALKQEAKHGETVPRDFAKAAVTEMRRSADQMEIYHEQAVRSLPADQQAELGKMMGKHLTEMKQQLGRLEDLTKGDRIDSQQVLAQVEPLLQGCQGMHGPGGPGMHERMHHGKGMMRGGGMMHGEGCGCGEAMRRGGCDHDMAMPHEMMQERQHLMAEMKAQDAEITKLVDRMNSSSGAQQQALMAQILTKMVQQRATLAAHFEKMQGEMMHHGGPDGPGCDTHHMHHGPGWGQMEGDDGDDMDMDSEGGDMNMNDMKMQ